MIDFNYTWEHKGIIGYVNERGETVARYPLSELEQYVVNTFANLTYEWVNHNGEPLEVEVYEPVSEYIDNNFEEITEKFYNFKNPTNYKANHTPSQTHRSL
jgi:hypothetical protein